MNHEGYSLYIHIPWCVKKCPYCDFNSHEKNNDYDENAYVNALIKDLSTEAPMVKGRSLKSIFIGGGTPSLFSAASIERILSAVNQQLNIADDIEITLEANPGTAEADKFSAFRQIGINRLSIGIQSFNDQHLTKLGRIHDSQQAHRAIKIAQEAGFERINLDLMFGLPEQTIDQAVSDVDTALSYQTGHLSHYQLTLEKNTLFHKYPPVLPHDEVIWDMQTACQKQIAKQLKQYEVSAYAAQQQQSQHNINYWQYGDYIGIGAGAHGKLTHDSGQITRSCKLKQPRDFMKKAGTASALGGENAVIVNELPFEYMMNALRLKAGFTLDQFSNKTGLSASVIQPTLTTLLDKKLLQLNHTNYTCTEQGWNFLNDTLEYFLPTK
ncbi:MAG TPA: oxygen-independent coproporphyrinogen III oxidase-like protein [Cycloclasticus sp.]|jgi:oxygen-independent coproporphyrinogen-3 oxidase|nr:oxygen-independent coproporphyrinogen III oxidase-like protein [Cycloclasticus sp.]HIL91827.1 oxygen-independent coproporphyrinogen III oxidase-like protein [Cycloclasticus sp.]